MQPTVKQPNNEFISIVEYEKQPILNTITSSPIRVGSQLLSLIENAVDKNPQGIFQDQ